MNIEKWSYNSFGIPKSIIPDHWRCPNCDGTLTLATKDVVKGITLESRKRNEPFQNEYRFAATLTCMHCQEVISISGEAYDDEDYEDDHNGQTHIIHYIRFSPKFFLPAIHLFPILKPIRSSTLFDPLVAAFGHFFSDSSACANKIRLVIEALLTEWYIPKTVRKNGKRSRLTTHARIEKFGAGYPEVAELMMAIKWIGNDGSHDGYPLKQKDLLVGFDLLEHIIKDLYDDSSKRVRANAKYINKRKGIAAKRKGV